MSVLASPAASQVVPGVLGFLVVAGLGVVCYFLFRSMNKHLRKVVREPKWREEAQQEAGPAGQPEQDYSHNGSGQA